MYKLTCKIRVKPILTKCILDFGRYQVTAKAGDVLVSFGNELSCIFPGEKFYKIAEEIKIEKKFSRKGKKYG